MKNILWVLLIFSLALGACRSSREVFTPPVIINEDAVTAAMTGDLVKKEIPSWAPKDFGYKPSRTRTFDLLDTRLDLRFDWEKRHVLGKATLQLTPYFYSAQHLLLDAQAFDLHRVALLTEEGMRDLSFTYDSVQIHIDLGREYSRGDTFSLWIDYTAKPYERETGGGQAITSDRGLYFINHDGSNPEAPMQIWTQGETQSNSCWFPTIDSPNEKCTQDLKLTVLERFLTVSNGRKVSSTLNGDGTRTDHWVQDLKHPTYLFALAIGDFVEVKDQWRDLEVNYYMEKNYAPYARQVFGNTPEMLEFFSNRLGVDYPWDKFAQIVVREFVSGAMENTGCVIFYDGLNQDKGENLDSPQDDIIAHELFHHWFGDLVTCESWANLGLNESFASYGEYLWFEYKEGKDAADHHLMNDLGQYLMEAQSKREPIIRYGYKSTDDMFDRHSYQKGACVLHMLRNYVGDDAFFAALNLYLRENAYQNAEIHQLRLAFEEVTGEDLNWFFNQWFLSAGHPELMIRHEQELELSNTQEAGRRILKVSVRQDQDLEYQPIFRLPVKMQVMYVDGSMSLHPVELRTRDTVFVIEVDKPVAHVVFDGDGVLVAGLNEQFDDLNAAILQLRYGQTFRQKNLALSALSEYIEQEDVIEVFLELLQNPLWTYRESAVNALRRVEGGRQKEILEEFIRLSKEDPHPAVRAAAVGSFARSAVKTYVEIKQMTAEVQAMSAASLADSSYQVQSKALAVLNQFDPEAALAYAKEMGAVRNPALLGQGTRILMGSGEGVKAQQIIQNLELLPLGMEKIQLMRDFPEYLLRQPQEELAYGVSYLEKSASEDPEWIMRLVFIQTLEELDKVEGVKDFLRQRAEAEEHPQVKEYLQGLKE